jgi:hypothetical protein
MPLWDVWGPAAAPTAPEVAAGGADKDLTTSQRNCLIGGFLMAQEAIEDEEGPDALVRLPRRRLRLSHQPAPRPQPRERARPRVPALLVLVPRVTHSKAPQVRTSWNGTSSWTCLGKLPGLPWTSFFWSSLLSSRCFLSFMQQGSLPGTLSQAGPGRCPCAQ